MSSSTVSSLGSAGRETLIHGGVAILTIGLPGELLNYNCLSESPNISGEFMCILLFYHE